MRDIQEQLINASAPSLELMRAASNEIALLRSENMKFLGLLQDWFEAYGRLGTASKQDLYPVFLKTEEFLS